MHQILSLDAFDEDKNLLLAVEHLTNTEIEPKFNISENGFKSFTKVFKSKIKSLRIYAEILYFI